VRNSSAGAPLLPSYSNLQTRIETFHIERLGAGLVPWTWDGMMRWVLGRRQADRCKKSVVCDCHCGLVDNGNSSEEMTNTHERRVGTTLVGWNGAMIHQTRTGDRQNHVVRARTGHCWWKQLRVAAEQQWLNVTLALALMLAFDVVVTPH
jgi:hypothetical protein